MKKLLALGIVICMALWAGAGSTQEIPNREAIDIAQIEPDLVVPAMAEQAPAPGLRVKQTTSGYEDTQVHHALYLPTDWQKGKKYPVIVEYAGNQWRTSPGTVQGSNLGYGISGGKGFIWICMPFLNGNSTANVGSWWGDRGTHQAQPTVDYCVKTVREVCQRYGGDSDAVILCGFSRGSIACNYIGLHDDEIAKLWRAFVCYSHYDGVDERQYLPKTKREYALERLKRLDGRPQFICCEAPSRGRNMLQDTKDYIESTGVKAPFTYTYTGFLQHDDAWTLRPCAARKALRAWLKDVLDE